MRYATVCSGIEAPSVAWHPLGWEPVFFSEIEKHPCAVLKHHHPDVPNYGDLNGYKDWPHHDIDLLCGGTPCQSFSVAGLRKGLADPRGNLALVFLGVVDRYKPRWVVWENVPGVLSSHGGRDFGSFVGGLEELGYGIAWRVLDAQFTRTRGHPRAVPQRRRRVFVVGHPGDWRRAAAVLSLPESLSGHPAPRREAGKSAAPTIASRPTGGGGFGTDFDCDGGLVSVGLKAVAHSLKADGFDASEDGTGRGTPIVPVVAGTLKQNGGKGTGAENGAELADTLVAYSIQGAATRENPASGPDGVGVRQDGAAYTLEARQEVQAIAFTQNSRSEVRKIGDDGGVVGALAADAGAQQQNYVAFNAREDTDVSGDKAGPLGSSSPQAQAIATPWAVRRLTPLECLRLQGFPDDYFDGVLDHRGKPLADGPKYKMLGNSMAVNCMEWLGECIQAADQPEGERPMSLEEALAANTAAIEKLTAALARITPAEKATVEAAKPAAKPAVKKPAAVAIEPEPNPWKLLPEAAAQELVNGQTAAAPVLTYAMLAAKVNKAAAQDRAKAIALLAGFGAKTLKDVGESEWASLDEELDKWVS